MKRQVMKPVPAPDCAGVLRFHGEGMHAHIG